MRASFRFLLIGLISALLVTGLCPVFADAYGATPDSIQIAGGPYVHADSVNHVNLTATVLDRNGRPVSGIFVHFTIGDATKNYFMQGGFPWTPANGSFTAGPSYSGISLNNTTGNDGTVTIPFGWVDYYYRGNSSWVWAYVRDYPSLNAKMKIEFTYPTTIIVSAEPVSIVANSRDRSYVTAQVFDNKGNPFSSGHVNFTIGDATKNSFMQGGFPWTPANGSFTEGPSYSGISLNNPTGNDGKSSVVFGWADEYYKGNCSYVWAYLADWPSYINGKVKICFQPPVRSIGVFRNSTHLFYLDYNGNGVWNGAAIDWQINFGLTGDIPVSGDWNNDGFTEIGVFRNSTHLFYLDYNGNGAWNGAVTDKSYNFGITGDIPISGDWNSDGRTEIGVFRNSTHLFYLDYNGNGVWNGPVIDRQYNFGTTGDKPVSGMW